MTGNEYTQGLAVLVFMIVITIAGAIFIYMGYDEAEARYLREHDPKTATLKVTDQVFIISGYGIKPAANSFPVGYVMHIYKYQDKSIGYAVFYLINNPEKPYQQVVEGLFSRSDLIKSIPTN